MNRTQPPILLLIVGVITATLLSACTATSGPQPPPGTPAAAPTEWHPATPIAHSPVLSEQERQAARSSYLKSLARTDKLKHPPKVALIRWTTIDDADATMATCYTDGGFPAHPVPDGGIEFSGDGVPAAQESAFNLVDYTCSAQYSLDPKYRQDWTKDQIGLVYDYWSQFFVPCLTARGRNLSTPPTRDTFIANFPSAWNPVIEGQLTTELAAACPPRPPAHDMYG